MRTMGGSGGGVNGRLNEVIMLQSDQESTVTVMRNYHLNPFSFFSAFAFHSLNANMLLLPGRAATLIAVLGVKKANQRVCQCFPNLGSSWCSRFGASQHHSVTLTH